MAEKLIQLVYYDARDVTFDDIGLAPQLLELCAPKPKSMEQGRSTPF